MGRLRQLIAGPQTCKKLPSRLWRTMEEVSIKLRRKISKLKGLGLIPLVLSLGYCLWISRASSRWQCQRVLVRLFEVTTISEFRTNRKIFSAMMEISIDPARPGDFNLYFDGFGIRILNRQSIQGRRESR